jgi:hypothetical protein
MAVERQAGASISSGGTPGAHATTHVTGGSDVIADAVAGGAAGLMTGTMATKLAGIETAATADMTGAEIATALAGVTVPGNIVAAEDSTPSRRGQINTQVAGRVTVESGAVDLYLGTWSAFDFTGTQRTHIRCQNDAPTLWLGPSVINFTADFTNAAMFVNLASGTCGLGFKNSLSNLRINGRSQSANGAPTSGTWVQHDTIVGATEQFGGVPGRDHHRVLSGRRRAGHARRRRRCDVAQPARLEDRGAVVDREDPEAGDRRVGRQRRQHGMTRVATS